MKKFGILLIILTIFISQSLLLAEESSIKTEIPKWEDYVPEKYQNPRQDFSRGGALGEMITGIVLTDLLITAPIGIPMICHGATKFKHVSYRDKKEKFEQGLKYAETLTTEEEKREYYKKLHQQCGLKESTKMKNLRKRAKQEAKEARKAQKSTEKEEKQDKSNL